MTHNDADAADVVQEAYLRAFRYLDSYRDGDAKSWLLRIVRRTSYSWLERNHPPNVVSLEAESETGDMVASVFANRELYLVLANYGDKGAIIETAERFIDTAEDGQSAGTSWELPGRSLKILKKGDARR